MGKTPSQENKAKAKKAGPSTRSVFSLTSTPVLVSCVARRRSQGQTDLVQLKFWKQLEGSTTHFEKHTNTRPWEQGGMSHEDANKQQAEDVRATKKLANKAGDFGAKKNGEAIKQQVAMQKIKARPRPLSVSLLSSLVFSLLPPLSSLLSPLSSLLSHHTRFFPAQLSST
jgi:hypothetical protein